jgi:hypothetical protein
MQRIPFHFGLFYHAMIGLIGREPDRQVCQGYDGFYEFRYLPRDRKEATDFATKAQNLAEWLDNFEIVFSGSKCSFGLPTPPQAGDKETLQIRISHPKEKKSPPP